MDIEAKKWLELSLKNKSAELLDIEDKLNDLTQKRIELVAVIEQIKIMLDLE